MAKNKINFGSKKLGRYNYQYLHDGYNYFYFSRKTWQYSGYEGEYRQFGVVIRLYDTREIDDKPDQFYPFVLEFGIIDHNPDLTELETHEKTEIQETPESMYFILDSHSGCIPLNIYPEILEDEIKLRALGISFKKARSSHNDNIYIQLESENDVWSLIEHVAKQDFYNLSEYIESYFENWVNLGQTYTGWEIINHQANHCNKINY